MGEHIAQWEWASSDREEAIEDPDREAIGRQLLDVVVYAKGCRVGDALTLDDLAETSEVGDWKMPDFKMACSYAAAQGWLIIKGNSLTLTTAGSAAA